MKLLIFCCLIASILAKPGRLHVQKAFVAEGIAPPPLTLDNGNVGVNLGGLHASAGLGGILTGDASKGGLHAEAGTGFGQEAAAGIAGAAGGAQSGGALYAGATANAASAASAASSASAGIESEAYGHKTIHQNTQIVSEKTVTEAAKVVAEKTIQEAPVVHRTVIEKTVIPQYVEKTIQVPSYVEKTIRVPTVVEHKVKVPVTPKIVEKTYDESSAGASAGASAGVSYTGQTVALQKRPVVTVQKQYYSPGLFGAFGRYGVSAGGNGAVAGSSAGAASAGAAAAAGSGAGGATYTKTVYKSPQLFNNIFNIPIAALQSVNNLLNGLAGGGGASGSLAVSKHYSTY